MTDIPSAQQIAEDVSFTEATIDDAMIEQPALVAHYGRLLADVQYDMDMAKQTLEITEAREAQNLRDEAADNGEKITEAKVNSTLPTIDKVMKARKRYNRAKADHEAMRTTLEALRHKKDMMIQIAVSRRTELENKINGLARLDAARDRDADLRDRAAKVSAVA